MIVCESCGCENEDEFSYCRKCGTPLEAEDDEPEEDDEPVEINCPNCGMEQPSNFKFCGACGEEIPDSLADKVAQSGGSAPSGSSPSAGSASQPPSGSGESASTSSPSSSGAGAASQSASGGAGAASTSPPSSGGGRSTGNTGKQAYSQDVDDRPGRGSPAPGSDVASQSAGRLVVIQPDGTEGASIDLPRDRITIGRDSEVETLSEDFFLSPEHASIHYRNGQFVLRDEDSVNGIFREVTDRVTLSDGALIRIGKELLEFETFPPPPEQNEEGTKIGGSPDPGCWGRLSLVAGPGIYTEAYALEDERLVIGREEGDVLFRDDGFVSGTHAAVVDDGGTPVLEDLNSSNGTFIKIEKPYQIDPGEKILMGQQLFKLEAR